MLRSAAGLRTRTSSSLIAATFLLWLLSLQPSESRTEPESRTWSQTGPRLQLSHSDVRNGSAVYWGAGVGGDYQVLLLDEDRGWLLVGGKDHIYLLNPDNLDQPVHKIHWPATREHVEHCRLAGKSLERDCANFVRVLQPFNKTHVYVCGTGAFHPQCSYLQLGQNPEEPWFRLSHAVESGRGKCPFSPREPFTARLTDGELYAGTSVDFMGANAAIFRTSVQGSSQHYIRTEACDHNWLNEPDFVGSFSIPDTHSPDDDKVYFFFKEKAVEAGQWDQRVYSRVARVCKNDVGGKRSLINRWTTFLKARLVCSVPGPSGVDTHFDELEDIFVLETKDPQNPTIYGVFTTSSSIFQGSAVCVYSMASIRAAFNGPFAHREGPDYRWVEYKGRIPYPRPGTCPSETYDALHKSTKDFPDEVVSFMRQHQLMWDPVLPLGGRPVLTRVNSPNLLKRVVVDRVEAEDGPYDVLHLGTDDGKVVKAVSVIKDNWETEEVILEELTVFQIPTPILSMELSTKREQLYVCSELGLVQLGLQRCELYGSDCAECCLARDPYCSWDGQTCSRYFPTSRRRARRQDVKYGDPRSQCPVTEEDSDSVEVKVVYGVEGNSTFLECVPRSLQAELRWTVQRSESQQNAVSQLPLSDDDRFLSTKRGLLAQRLELTDAGLYTCTSQDHSYSQVLGRYRVHIIPNRSLHLARYLQNLSPNPPDLLILLRTGPAGGGAAGFLGQSETAPLPPHRNSWPPPLRSYKDLQMVGSNRQSVDEYCEKLWYREKRKQEKRLKLKHENRKARVRRNNPPEVPL
ncbi:semaphorin-3D [Poecilia reticulata]|uniref:semaphorin-3D n=1 Tax=Poecilia reticulata TaxID=8081 RepID=UPI0004A368D9|nr:PREDICTED: semaphorin-3D-like [Poecilia reticulata]XP_008407099.1 PREDICTED: semaphorin-3D-like [Poecilia reticulata]